MSLNLGRMLSRWDNMLTFNLQLAQQYPLFFTFLSFHEISLNFGTQLQSVSLTSKVLDGMCFLLHTCTRRREDCKHQQLVGAVCNFFMLLFTLTCTSNVVCLFCMQNINIANRAVLLLQVGFNSLVNGNFQLSFFYVWLLNVFYTWTFEWNEHWSKFPSVYIYMALRYKNCVCFIHLFTT